MDCNTKKYAILAQSKEEKNQNQDNETPKAKNWWCEICRKSMHINSKKGHIAGKQHIMNQTHSKPIWTCEICDKVLHAEKKISHLNSLRHQRQEKKLMRENMLANRWECEICGESMDISLKLSHTHKKKHQEKLQKTNPTTLRYISMTVSLTPISYIGYDLAPSHVVLINEEWKIVMDEFIKVPQKKEDAGYMSLSQIVYKIKMLLGRDVMLIGHKINETIKTLYLEKGTDYIESIELADEFKYSSESLGQDIEFSLEQQAHTLLNIIYQSNIPHTVWSAQTAMQLYKFWVQPGKSKQGAVALARMWENVDMGNMVFMPNQINVQSH